MKPILKYIIFSLSISILCGCAVKTTKYKIKIVGQIGSIDEYGNAVLDRKSSEQAKAHLKLGDSLSVRFDESQESLTCKMVKDYGDVPVGDYLARFDNDSNLRVVRKFIQPSRQHIGRKKNLRIPTLL